MTGYHIYSVAELNDLTSVFSSLGAISVTFTIVAGIYLLTYLLYLFVFT